MKKDHRIASAILDPARTPRSADQAKKNGIHEDDPMGAILRDTTNRVIQLCCRAQETVQAWGHADDRYRTVPSASE